LAEYTGVRSVDARLVSDLIRAAEELVDAVRALPPPDVES